MKNVKLVIEYDGTLYSGWQKQKNALTIQEVIERVLYSVTGEKINILGSSRTDAGVHARGFVGNFFTSSNIPSEKFKDVLNGRLPNDIVIQESKEVAMDFHSRYCSKGKTYSYTVLNRPQRSAIGRNYSFYYRKKLDIDAIKEAMPLIIGTHDFSAFKSTGGSAKTDIRTISNFEIATKNDYLIFYITGNGFLYNMVRIIMGTIIQVGLGKIESQSVKDIILSKDRNMAGPCLPANGLCLEKVYY